MSADAIPGPRAGDKRGGAYQAPSLSTEVSIRLPVDWQGEYVRLSWSPVTGGAKLFYLFVADPDPSSDTPAGVPTIDESTASALTGSVSYARVANAPDWIEGAGSDDVQVPLDFRGTGGVLILLKPESVGRMTLRQAER